MFCYLKDCLIFFFWYKSTQRTYSHQLSILFLNFFYFVFNWKRVLWTWKIYHSRINIPYFFYCISSIIAIGNYCSLSKVTKINIIIIIYIIRNEKIWFYV